jgi:hypothetical protein
LTYDADMAVITTPRVIITWPRTVNPPWQVGLVDADTGQNLGPNTLAATVTVDPTGGVYADLQMMTDTDGNPLHPGGQALLTGDGTTYRQDSFRYAVAEMRIHPDETHA